MLKRGSKMMQVGWFIYDIFYLHNFNPIDLVGT